MEEIIGLLFYARTVTHIEHLKTKSYAKHKALGKFYDGVIDLADNLAEAYQGDRGLLGPITQYAKIPDYAIDVFLEKQMKSIEELLLVVAYYLPYMLRPNEKHYSKT
jgi:hypothetical protein